MNTNDQYAEETELVEGIRQGGARRESVWKHITLRWGGSILAVVVQRSGCSERQAREAFSSACVGVDNRIRKTSPADFLQKASLKTYLTQAAIYAALTHVKTKPQTMPLDFAERLAAEDEEVRRRTQHCAALLDSVLDQFGARCKRILLLFNDGYSMEEIGLELGFKNAAVARREKYECQERFKAHIQKNPEVKKQLRENCYG